MTYRQTDHQTKCVSLCRSCKRIQCCLLLALPHLCTRTYWQLAAAFCKQTWLLLWTDAGRAVTTSVFGPVSTILLQYLSVFHYHYLSTFPLRSYILHLGSEMDNYCHNVNYIHPYLTLPYHSGQAFLPPSAEACSGPNAHPRINTKVIETFCRFLQTWGGCSSVLVLGHPVLRDTFQRIHTVSRRWHSSCLRDAICKEEDDHPLSIKSQNSLYN